MEPQANFIPYPCTPRKPEEAYRAVHVFTEQMKTRRSLRHFSTQHINIDLIRTAVEAATTAPSGANKQPWSFCIVSDPALKKAIRIKAEAEEYQNYHGRMNAQWLDDLQALGTDHHKPFLEEAPYLIVVFKKPFEIVNGQKVQNYYVNESVGIAVGILLAALHQAGLGTLTHTPSPMGFLASLLRRPDNERAYLLIPVGLPHCEAQVPNICKKPVHKMVWEYL